MSPITKSGKRAVTGMSIYEHLREARKRMLISLIAVVVLGAVAFLDYNQILSWLRYPYCQVSKSCAFYITGPLDGLTLRIKIAFFGGLILGSPVIFYELWRFITPGLKSREKKYAIPFVLASIIFFLAGCATAYLVFEHALKFLQTIGGSELRAIYNPVSYLNLITLMMLIFGLVFEFPVILVSLEMVGVVSSAKLLQSWRWAIIGITIMAAVLTPSGDPFSMFALGLPLVVFYFGAIGVGKLAGK